MDFLFYRLGAWTDGRGRALLPPLTSLPAALRWHGAVVHLDDVRWLRHVAPVRRERGGASRGGGAARRGHDCRAARGGRRGSVGMAASTVGGGGGKDDAVRQRPRGIGHGGGGGDSGSGRLVDASAPSGGSGVPPTGPLGATATGSGADKELGIFVAGRVSPLPAPPPAGFTLLQLLRWADTPTVCFLLSGQCQRALRLGELPPKVPVR